MPKPREWKKINDIRFQLYMDVFDDINRILGDLEYQTYLLGEKARMELHHIIDEKAHLYKDVRKQKGLSKQKGVWQEPKTLQKYVKREKR